MNKHNAELQQTAENLSDIRQIGNFEHLYKICCSVLLISENKNQVATSKIVSCCPRTDKDSQKKIRYHNTLFENRKPGG